MLKKTFEFVNQERFENKLVLYKQRLLERHAYDELLMYFQIFSTELDKAVFVQFGKVLKEYSRENHGYLKIENDDKLFVNALEFPLMYDNNGVTIVRAPAAGNDDGSIVMSADVKVGTRVRLSYGEPSTIMNADIDMYRSKDSFRRSRSQA